MLFPVGAHFFFLPRGDPASILLFPVVSDFYAEFTFFILINDHRNLLREEISSKQ